MEDTGLDIPASFVAPDDVVEGVVWELVTWELVWVPDVGICGDEDVENPAWG